jgi:hypothetical protein
MSSLMFVLIIIGYLVMTGIFKKIIDETSSLGEDGMNFMPAVLWPFLIPYFIGIGIFKLFALLLEILHNWWYCTEFKETIRKMFSHKGK